MADKKSRELVMAKLYFKNKDYKMAEKSFNEYLDMNPEDVLALKLLAQVYEQNKRFDKAFEMYERCYLAEPDRTGILLDICRILLMNEIWLEHVDYRKWLNLAIKAFPSNPIVVNFKAFLSTLPPEDQSNQQGESPCKTSFKSSGEDPLIKILDKLSAMEKKQEKMDQRIEKIAEKLDNLNISQTQTVTKPWGQLNLMNSQLDHLNQKNQGSVAPSGLMLSDVPKQAPPVQQIALEKSKTPENKSSPAPAPAPKESEFSNFRIFGSLKTPEAPLTTATPFGGFSTNLFANSMNKFDIPTQAPPATTSSNSFSFTPTVNFADSIKKFDSPVEASSTSFNTSPSTNTFGLSTNLFAESIKKLNLPTEGSWVNQQSSSGFSFSPSRKEDNDNNAEEEVVQNEELPLENTCDMTPIEIKTGEEDEDLLFEHRCKLFRFKDKEYKERGLGSIKVLKHRSTGKGRLIMRREAIGLVCLNCWDCSKIERVKDTQVRWAGVDASDGEAEMTVFLVKLKTPELTEIFMNHLTALFSEDSTSPNTSISAPVSKDKATNSTNSAKDKPDVELISPKLDQSLVDKARKLQLPDLFYHKLENQEPCSGCNGCEKDE